MDRDAVVQEMEAARATFHELLRTSGAEALRRRSDGTRWTNEQLLFHMLLGYLVVRLLVGFVLVFGHLPRWVSTAFAAALDAVAGPFHALNYVGSVVGPKVLGHRGMHAAIDAVIASLQRGASGAATATLDLGMRFPTTWDPYFRAYMTLADLYHYPSEHFEHHRRQLTLDPG